MDKKFVGKCLSIRMGIDYGLKPLILIFLNIWILALQPEQFFFMCKKILINHLKAVFTGTSEYPLRHR